MAAKPRKPVIPTWEIISRFGELRILSVSYVIVFALPVTVSILTVIRESPDVLLSVLRAALSSLPTEVMSRVPRDIQDCVRLSECPAHQAIASYLAQSVVLSHHYLVFFIGSFLLTVADLIYETRCPLDVKHAKNFSGYIRLQASDVEALNQLMERIEPSKTPPSSDDVINAVKTSSASMSPGAQLLLVELLYRYDRDSDQGEMQRSAVRGDIQEKLRAASKKEWEKITTQRTSSRMLSTTCFVLGGFAYIYALFVYPLIKAWPLVSFAL